MDNSQRQYLLDQAHKLLSHEERGIRSLALFVIAQLSEHVNHG